MLGDARGRFRLVDLLVLALPELLVLDLHDALAKASGFTSSVVHARGLLAAASCRASCGLAVRPVGSK